MIHAIFISVHFSYPNSCIQNKISKIASEHFVVLNLSNHIALFSIGHVGKLNKVNFSLFLIIQLLNIIYSFLLTVLRAAFYEYLIVAYKL